MLIGIVHEVSDPRVALGPDVAKLFIDAGNQVLIETGAGKTAYFEDDVYIQNGVQISDTREDVLNQAEIIITLTPLPESEWELLRKGTILVSLYQPYIDASIKEKLQKEQFIVFSLDMIPRSTIAQSMDVLSSMASVAGYQAVLEAAQHLPRYFPMLSTAAGTVAPAKVLVLGAGVAGLQAIATAKRLGAIVEAFDTRVAAKEEVESLGARFVEVEGALDDKSAGGYAVEQSTDYKKKQQEKIAEKATQSDVIITTALVRGPKAPILISKEVVESMRPGSVIVDLASATGGNCEMTKDNKIIHHQHVTIIGNSNLASKVSLNATQLFGKNVFNFLSIMLNKGTFEPDWDHTIVKESCIAKPESVQI